MDLLYLVLGFLVASIPFTVIWWSLTLWLGHTGISYLTGLGIWAIIVTLATIL